MKKITKINFAIAVFHIIGLVIFLSGIFRGNWYMLVGGFLMQFRQLEIVHWQGEEIT